MFIQPKKPSGVKIHNRVDQFGAAADGLLTGVEEEVITLTHGITKQGEVIKKVDIIVAFVQVQLHEVSKY